MYKKICYSRTTLVILILLLGIFFLTQCVSKDRNQAYIVQNPNYSDYAGSVTCVKCHKSIYDTHIHTAHYLTFQPATEENILGSFEAGKNSFVFNDHKKVIAQKRSDGYYQVEYDSGFRKTAHRFDIVVGSGVKGQTYLYWDSSRLYQLPLGYFTTAAAWANSPGYPDRVIFNRVVGSRCLECHATYAKINSPPGISPPEYDPKKMIYGIDCEKCHGPAARHVDFQTRNPKDTRGKFILNPGKLDRLLSLNLCTLCHGGRFIPTQPSFSFQAGDTLSNYFSLVTSKKRATSIDVHGNQYGLLAASKCFRMSQLTCVTCHDVHKNEAGKIALFSQRCQSCHSAGHEITCRMTTTLGNSINNNCIDCHMPKKPSHSITLLLQENEPAVSATIRTHYIKIYPEETRKFIASRQSKK
jgi:hypothetical protein